MGRNGKKANGEGAEARPSVLEATRIQIAKRLEEFRAAEGRDCLGRIPPRMMDTPALYTFEPTLTNPERAVVHELCKKMGMVSKSAGNSGKPSVKYYQIKGKRNRQLTQTLQQEGLPTARNVDRCPIRLLEEQAGGWRRGKASGEAGEKARNRARWLSARQSRRSERERMEDDAAESDRRGEGGIDDKEEDRRRREVGKAEGDGDGESRRGEREVGNWGRPNEMALLAARLAKEMTLPLPACLRIYPGSGSPQLEPGSICKSSQVARVIQVWACIDAVQALSGGGFSGPGSGVGNKEETNDVLRDLFTRYPPDDGELIAEATRDCAGRASRGQGKRDSSFSRPSMSKDDITKKVDLLASRINENPEMRKIAEDRSKLPIASFRDMIMSTLESHQTRKLTVTGGADISFANCNYGWKWNELPRVPQFLLEYMWAKVAERISYERGEHVGETVGYKIRLESKGGKNTSIMFCTNGVLLRMLIGVGSGTSNEEATNESLKDLFVSRDAIASHEVSVTEALPIVAEVAL
ncbi:hypothetical protein ACLOJK_020502 [Asimina triloba]